MSRTDPASYFDGLHIYGSLHDTEHGTGKGAMVARPALAAAIAAVT